MEFPGRTSDRDWQDYMSHRNLIIRAMTILTSHLYTSQMTFHTCHTMQKASSAPVQGNYIPSPMVRIYQSTIAGATTINGKVENATIQVRWAKIRHQCTTQLQWSATHPAQVLSWRWKSRKRNADVRNGRPEILEIAVVRKVDTTQWMSIMQTVAVVPVLAEKEEIRLMIWPSLQLQLFMQSRSLVGGPGVILSPSSFKHLKMEVGHIKIIFCHIYGP